MTCDEIATLISARIDGESTPIEDAVLEAHLAGCAACRASLDAAEIQDAALVRACAGARNVADAIARRVERQLSAEALIIEPQRLQIPPHRPRWARWAGWVSSAAAGFIVALIFVHLSRVPEAQPEIAANPPAELVAHLSVSSGEVFTCPSNEQTWQSMAPGDALATGAKIRTAEAAKCELVLSDGSRLRLNSGTELRLPALGNVQLSNGQIWSAVSQDAGPLRIAAGDARVTTRESAQLDVACAVNSATVTVMSGSAQVGGRNQAAIVRGGESLRVDQPEGNYDGSKKWGCTPVNDLLGATRWLDDLLVLLPPDDPELLARVDALLERIVAEHTRAGIEREPGPIERDLRARGGTWAPSIARYARKNISIGGESERGRRQAAARLLADLASPSCVPDLIALLADEDSTVRFNAAAALRRLTGQTLGFSPEECGASPRDPAPLDAWQRWLIRNRSEYVDPPRNAPQAR